jgi:glycosyltransferase involved in cell wall biosynthesis
MNVVLLAYHYPPDPAVGSLRPAKVVDALRKSGHTVTVITATLPEEQAGTRHAEPGLKVVAIQPQRNPREWYAAWKRRRAGHSSQSGQRPAQAEAAYAIPARVPLWKRTIFSFMLLPDHRQGFIRPAIRMAAPLLREPNSVLYTTAPPFSVHLAGWRLSRKVRVPWVAEFRDPWTDNAWKPWHVRTAFTDSAERWMERQVLRRASLVVAVSEGIRRGLGTRMEERTGRLVTVINGIDRLLQPPTATKGEPFRIVHIGSFYYGRDPRMFLSALAALPCATTYPLTHPVYELTW